MGVPFGPLPPELIAGVMGEGDARPHRWGGRAPAGRPRYEPRWAGSPPRRGTADGGGAHAVDWANDRAKRVNPMRQKVKNLGRSQGFSVEAAGVEWAESAEIIALRDDSHPDDASRVDASPRIETANGPPSDRLGSSAGGAGQGGAEDIEGGLVRSLEAAARAGAWDVVGALAAELRERRLAAAGVAVLDVERARRAR